MNIAFIHYHLMRGGVTTVIRHQVEALRTAGWNVLVITGGPVEIELPAPIVTIAGLGYESLESDPYSSVNIAENIISAIGEHWSHGADVVHVHNPTLAKNRYLQDVLAFLQQSGLRLLCQVHDFAEDGRPSAYFTSPYVGNCHYAVINARDRRLLLEAGLKPEGCHLLPNAIAPLGDQIPPAADSDEVLYPIRAIRRKNIGEALLLTHYFNRGNRLSITLPPTSAADVQSYRFWRAFARERHLPVRFDAGLQADFLRLMSECRFVLTTSVTEGFGFAFLEPWTGNKALWGRLLPETCQGFIDQGVHLDHLYTRLPVDMDWVDAGALEKRWKMTMTRAACQFDVEMSPKEVDAAFELVCVDGCIDFGLLSEPFQRQIIDRIRDDAKASSTLVSCNPFLDGPGPPDTIGPVIARNSKIISDTWHIDHYGPKLLALYRSVVDTDVRHAIDKQTLSRSFLSPRTFSLLKWEAFDG